MRRKGVGIVLLLAIMVSSAMYAESVEPREPNVIGSGVETAAAYLKSEDEGKRGVFYVSCWANRKGAASRDNYVLVIPNREGDAALFLVRAESGRKVVANVGTVTLGHGEIVFVEAMGGEWTYARMRQVIEQLKKRSFKLSFDYDAPFSLPYGEECKLTE